MFLFIVVFLITMLCKINIIIIIINKNIGQKLTPNIVDKTPKNGGIKLEPRYAKAI